MALVWSQKDKKIEKNALVDSRIIKEAFDLISSKINLGVTGIVKSFLNSCNLKNETVASTTIFCFFIQ